MVNRNKCEYSISGSIHDLPKEEWEFILRFGDTVMCSNMGRIKTKHSKSKTKFRILKYQLNECGYYTAQICRNKKRVTFLVHRQVAKLFVPNPHNLPQVNHKKGVKTDNRASELEWNTHAENINHAKNVLGHFCGLKNHHSKFCEQDVLDIFYSKDTNRNIAKKYKVSHNVVGDIKRKKSYKDIVGNLVSIKKTSKSGRLFDEDVIAIFNSNLKRADVCREFNISKHIYHSIKSKRTYLSILKSA